MFDVSVLLKIIGVSASGALAPGPLTASSVAVGAKESWKGGLNIALGHTIIEFPLVLAIAFGLGSFFQISFVKLTLGFVGGVFLLFFGYLTLKDALKVKEFSSSNVTPKYNSSIFVGIALTAFNPYFIAWWISVGSALLLESVSVITLSAIILFYLAHVWLDYFWLILMSKVGSFSKINLKVYKIILILLAVMIIYFGTELIYKILLG
ncbi:MAG: LysE family translocator [Nitrososphaeria archaeon]|nr:LysE family translocator [Nitrososphaeria archaeon]